MMDRGRAVVIVTRAGEHIPARIIKPGRGGRWWVRANRSGLLFQLSEGQFYVKPPKSL